MRELPLPTLPLFDLRLARAPHRPKPRPSAPPITIPPAATPTRHAKQAAAAGFEVLWARHLDEVRQAQQLRHQVFVGEMGARLSVPPGTPAGHDIDIFDDHCEHLLLRAPAQGDEPGPVIGTYRVLTPVAAKRVGGLYSETELDRKSVV